MTQKGYNFSPVDYNNNLDNLMHFSSPHCPKNNLNLLIKTEPGTVGAVARVYVWFLSQIHIIYTIPLHLLQYSTLEWPSVLHSRLCGYKCLQVST